jgi:hypothetical protein
MNQLGLNYLKIPMLVIFTIFTVMIYNGSANAGDATMQTNLNNMADMMSKWSNQLSSGKMEPKAQKKLGEIMSQMSQVLTDLSAKKSDDMHMEHHNKIQQMKKDWDPFDTSDKD